MSEPMLDTESLKQLEWYHPNINRHIAETLLMKNGEEGAYLLRNRSSGNGNQFVLSVRTKDAVRNFEIEIKNGELSFGFGTFSSIDEFLKHFETQPLVAGENGVLTVMRFPYPYEVKEPGLYDTVRIHASVGPNRSIRLPKELAIGSKEGYLTKRGNNVKNWKTRWFTLQRNELKYFKDRSSKEPIKVLNLDDCMACSNDDTMQKDYCFSVKFPWRTFYMFASTREETEEWVALLQWKLNRIKETRVTGNMTL